MITNYDWVDNPTKTNVAAYDPDVLNECLMHLKYSSTDNNMTTYAVNASNKNSDGLADFISKVSDTEVSLDIDDGTNYEPLIVTFPDGSTITYTSLPNITSGLDSDGTHFFILEKGATNAVATTSTITESVIAPVNPSDGDYWLNISSKPYKPYKYVSGNWTETQYIKLGQVSKISSTLGTPISYALNGAYTSKIETLTLNTRLNFATNLGTDKVSTIKELKIYKNDDHTELAPRMYEGGSNVGLGIAVVDHNTIGVRFKGGGSSDRTGMDLSSGLPVTFSNASKVSIIARRAF